MGAKISNIKDVIIAVKEAYPLEEYIESNGVTLKKSGRNYKGLCPFHDEKTPSFMVYSDSQNYRCFGCGESGDIFDYAGMQENMPFVEIVEMLATEKNIPVESDQDSTVDYTGLNNVIMETALFFKKRFAELDDTHPARQQVTERGLSTTDMAYGYAPEGGKVLYQHLSNKGFSDDLILESGVCRKSEYGFYDFWRGRLMFFITDRRGKPVGFSGRKLNSNDKGGKYINSPESAVYHKSSTLFNIHRAAKSAGAHSELYVVEGQFDVAALKASGVDNVVAPSGTAFTSTQATMCLRLVGGTQGKLVFCFDGDKAGVKAAEKVFESNPEIHASSYVVVLPQGMDPCDYRMENGAESLVTFLETRRVSLVRFVLSQVLNRHDVTQMMGKTRFVEEAASYVAKINNMVLRNSAITDVSNMAVVTRSVVDDAVKKALSTDKPPRHAETEDTGENISDRSDAMDDVDTACDDDGREVCDIVEDDTWCLTSAMFLAIAARFAPLREKMGKIDRSRFPAIFNPALDDLAKASERPVMVAEMFTQPLVGKMLMSDTFYGMASQMTDKELQSHVNFLWRRLGAFRDDALRERSALS